MSVGPALVAARGHIVFIVALLASSITVLYLEDQLATPLSAGSKSLTDVSVGSGGVVLDLGSVSTAQHAAALWEQVRVTVPEVSSLPLVMRDAGMGITLALGPVPDDRRSKQACQHLVEVGVSCQIAPYGAGAAKR